MDKSVGLTYANAYCDNKRPLKCSFHQFLSSPTRGLAGLLSKKTLILGEILEFRRLNLTFLAVVNPNSVLCTDQALSPAFSALNPGSALNPRTLNPGATVT